MDKQITASPETGASEQGHLSKKELNQIWLRWGFTHLA